MASADLADAVLHAEGLVGRPDRVAVVEVHFALRRAVLDVRALDIDEAAQAVEQLAEGGLEVVGLRQGVALDTVGGGLGVLIDHVELDLDANRGGVAELGKAIDDTAQDAARRVLEQVAVMVLDVALHDGDALAPRQVACGRDIGDHEEVGVARLPAGHTAAVEDVTRVIPREGRIGEGDALIDAANEHVGGDALAARIPLMVRPGHFDLADLALLDRLQQIEVASAHGSGLLVIVAPPEGSTRGRIAVIGQPPPVRASS